LSSEDHRKTPIANPIDRFYPTGAAVSPSIDRVTALETAEATSAADLVLVRRAQAGDVDAFGELVERNRRAVFRAALAAVGSATEADDVAQEAFVTAFQKLAGFRGESSFKTWLLAITWRKAIDRRKSVTRWMQRLVAPAQSSETGEEWNPMDRVAAGGQSQEDELMTSDLQRRLRPLIASLPKKLRDVLLLAGSGDHSYDEIGTMLKIPTGTVKWRVSEARKVLKQKMTAMGYTDV
jgi:RNA polymerase sigma-70 factor (ECF subfamily)